MDSYGNSQLQPVGEEQEQRIDFTPSTLFGNCTKNCKIVENSHVQLECQKSHNFIAYASI